MAKEIEEARVRQKADTLENWMNNELPLLDGEQAFIRSDVDDMNIGFKLGSKNKKFSELPYPDYSVRGKVSPSSTWTGRQSGVYIPTLNGTYNGINVNLGEGYQVLYWDGTTLEKVVYPSDFTGLVFGGVIDDTKDLSNPTEAIWYIASPGTYNTVPPITLTEQSILTWNGTEWSHIPFELEVRGEFLVADNVEELRNITPQVASLLTNGTYKGVTLLGYYTPGDTPAPINYYLSDTTVEDDGGSVFEVGGIKLEHDFNGDIHVSYFGIISGLSFDNTLKYEKLSSYLKNGDRVTFKKGIYVGNFEITNKSVNIDGAMSEFIPFNDNKAVLSIRGSLSSELRNVVGNPGYGDKFVTVINASDYFSVGDIIQIKDEATRPADNAPEMNKEILKIKEIVGNNIFVEDMLRGTFNTGQVTLQKVLNISNVQIRNVIVSGTDTHLFPFVWITDCDNAIIDNVLTFNNYGNAVRLDRCYGGQTTNIYVNNPRATTSGAGYGISINECRHITSQVLHGNGTRHVLDYKCSYRCDAQDIYEPNAKSSVVVLAHNGFGGFISIKNLNSTGIDYALNVSSQGFSAINESVQVVRGYSIENVNHIWINKAPNIFTSCIRIDGDYSDISIKNITSNFDKDTDVSTLTTLSNVVMFTGDKKGYLNVSNISSDNIGCVVRLSSRLGINESLKHTTVLRNINSVRCLNAIWITSDRNIVVDGIFVDTAVDALLRINRSGSVNPNYIDITENGISYSLRSATSKLVSSEGVMPNALIKGSIPMTTASSGASLSVTEGITLPVDRLYNANKYCILSWAANTNIYLSSTIPIPVSFWEGHEVTFICRVLGVGTETGHLTIPTGSATVENSEPIVMKSGNSYTFIFYNGKWRLKSQQVSATTTIKGIVNQAASLPTGSTTDQLIQALKNAGLMAT